MTDEEERDENSCTEEHVWLHNTHFVDNFFRPSTNSTKYFLDALVWVRLLPPDFKG